jgi:hypothetical protein
MPDIFVDKEPTQEATPEETPDTPLSSIESEKKEISPMPNQTSDEELITRLELDPHKKRHLHVLSSYSENPSEVKFTNIIDDEILLLFLRRHFITNFPWIIKAVALAFIPLLFEILGSLGIISTGFLEPEGKFIIYLFYYFFIFSGYVFVNYMSWFYNISIVTNVRIIDIDFSQLIFENVAATKLVQLEDVNYAQIGLIRSIFDYGDVFLQTAGAASNFEFLAVPHPEKVIRVIGDLIGKKPK